MNQNPNPKILFLNHHKSQCGVYEYGVRLYTILKDSQQYNVSYKEVGNAEDYNQIPFATYKVIIYNYHMSTMNWLHHGNITKQSVNVGILHECAVNLFHHTWNIDPYATHGVPRPLIHEFDGILRSSNPKIHEFVHYGQEKNVPIIGSFGFGFTNKGFDKIVSYVNEQYDHAIIKLLMPFATYGDSNGSLSTQVARLCKEKNTKPNIEVVICHEYFDNHDILYFLASNNVNMFLYDTMHGRGISSVIDYALSVQTPICISDSYMFRHMYDDRICAYKTSIEDSIKNSQLLLPRYRTLWNKQNALETLESYLVTMI